MIRGLRLAPTLLLILVAGGCGAVFVGFVSTPGVPLSITGTVAIVDLGFADNGHGTVLVVTQVTIVDLGVTKIIAFCGDQRKQFPIDRPLRVEFTTGALCSTILAVIFLSPTADVSNAYVTGSGHGGDNLLATLALFPSDGEFVA